MQIWPENGGGSLGRLAKWAERHPRCLGLGLAVLYWSSVVNRAQIRPLWHDELFTFYIAQSTTWAHMWAAMRTVDLNPPLSYVLVRAVFHFFKPQPLTCRIPSMLAFLLGSAVLFVFLKRKTTAVYAAVGVLLLWNTQFFEYATEARPYALMFAFATIMLLGWQRATADERQWRGLFMLALGGFGLLLSHVFGVCVLSAFWLGEAVRCYLRRKFDGRVWACLSLPLISCVTYIPLIHNQSTVLFPPQWQPSAERTALIYQNQVQATFPVLLIMLLLAVLWRRKPSTAEFPLSIPESVLLMSLLLVPVEISLLLARTHGALFERYGIVAVIPFAALPALSLAWGSRRNAVAGLLLAACLGLSLYIPPRVIAVETLPLIMSPKHTVEVVQWVFPLPLTERPIKRLDSSYGKSGSFVLLSGLDDLHPELPIVAASPVTFLEMDNREAEGVAKRLHYLTDPEAAAQISHATLFNSYGDLKRVFPLRGTIEHYQDFVRANPRFLVVGTYGYPEDWLLQKLQADGAAARRAWRLELPYKDKDVYEITMPPDFPPLGSELANAGDKGAAGSKARLANAALGHPQVPEPGLEAGRPAASKSLVALGPCQDPLGAKLHCGSSRFNPGAGSHRANAARIVP
jgi:hypothetical protein